MNEKINYLFKHNPITEYLYNKILDLKCRNVEAYIFVANTGRSGSRSLTEIFNAVDDCVCLHEPYPKMISEFPAGANKEIYFDKVFRKLKRVYIKRAVAGFKYYVETNHLFIKNFVDPALRYFGNKVKIVHLVRDPVSVAASLYNLNDIPGKTLIAKYYYLDPRDQGNLIKIHDILFQDNEFKYDFYKCLWYWYEIETRIKKAKKKYPSTTFFKIKTEDLNNFDILSEMFKALKMPVSLSRLEDLIDTHINVRSNEKTRKVDMEKANTMNVKLIEAMEKRYGQNFWT